MHGVNPIVLRRLSCLKVYRIYATAQLTPSAVPTAARIADARFHKNLINLVLFSLVISFELKIKS